MDDELRLYKVRFQLLRNSVIHELVHDGYTFTRIVFARNQDEAWTTFYAYAQDRSCNPVNVSVKELSEEEMKQMKILVPLYKEYTT